MNLKENISTYGSDVAFAIVIARRKQSINVNSIIAINGIHLVSDAIVVIDVNADAQYERTLQV